MIQLRDIHKSFGKQQVLSGVDVDIENPGIYAILGPNGSGKTTLIKAIMDMVRPDSGKRYFDGGVIEGDQYRNQIAYLPQIARFPENLRTFEFLNLIEKIRGKADRKEELSARFGLEYFVDKRLRTLSGGMRQKVNLVSALMYDTPVIILDEPTIGLDPITLIRLKDWIRAERQRGKIILMTTHIMDLVEELAEEIIFLLEGKVYYRGTVDQLLQKTNTANTERAIAHLLSQQEL